MILVNGNQIAKEKFLKIEEKIKSSSLSLAVVQVGEDEVSKVYINAKKRELEKRGILVSLYKIEEKVTTEEVKEKMKGKVNNEVEETNEEINDLVITTEGVTSGYAIFQENIDKPRFKR